MYRKKIRRKRKKEENSRRKKQVGKLKKRSIERKKFPG